MIFTWKKTLYKFNLLVTKMIDLKPHFCFLLTELPPIADNCKSKTSFDLSFDLLFSENINHD